MEVSSLSVEITSSEDKSTDTVFSCYIEEVGLVVTKNLMKKK